MKLATAFPPRNFRKIGNAWPAITTSAVIAIQCTDPCRYRSASQTAKRAFRNIEEQCGKTKRAARRAQHVRRADIAAAHRAHVFAAPQLHQKIAERNTADQVSRRENQKWHHSDENGNVRKMSINGPAWTWLAQIQMKPVRDEAAEIDSGQLRDRLPDRSQRNRILYTRQRKMR